MRSEEGMNGASEEAPHRAYPPPQRAHSRIHDDIRNDSAEEPEELRRLFRQRPPAAPAPSGSLADTRVNGDRASRLPNTTNIGFAPLEAEAILLMLSERNICASAGAACSSGSLEASPVLRAMRVPEAYAHGSVRFSLSRYTTHSEIDRAAQVLPEVISRLRSIRRWAFCSTSAKTISIVTARSSITPR